MPHPLGERDHQDKGHRGATHPVSRPSASSRAAAVSCTRSTAATTGSAEPSPCSGRPASQAQWRAINLAAAGLLLVLALLPVAALPLRGRPRLRPVLLALCWVLAVGLTMHGLIDDVQRALSLAGALRIHYPFFASVNTRAADIQDLAFNETWFIAEGFLWGALAWISLGRSSARRWWIGTALAEIAVLVSIGLFSAFGIIGKFIVG